MKFVKDGRIIEPGPACRKLNPHLFAAGNSTEQKVPSPELQAIGCKRIRSQPDVGVDRLSRRIRQDSKPLLNKLEQNYYEEVICNKFLGSSPISIQSIRFRLGNGIWYKPDFFLWYTSTVLPCKPMGIEVKGPYVFRGGFENLKVVANQYQWIKWVLVWKENGSWKEQVVLP